MSAYEGYGAAIILGREDLRGLLSAQPIIAFAATTQPARALSFYAFVLGLGLIEDAPHALVFDAGGSMLHVQKLRTFVPASHTVLGWHVNDILAARHGLESRGIKCELAPGLLADKDGVWTGPAGDRMIWFRDPDGNLLSLVQLQVR